MDGVNRSSGVNKYYNNLYITPRDNLRNYFIFVVD